MGEVVRLNCLTTLDISPDDVLNSAVGKLDQVLILGWDKDGELYVASSTSDMKLTVYLATKFVHKEMNGDYSN